MAEYCNQCAVKLKLRTGLDRIAMPDTKAKTICEGCGVIEVDQFGNCMTHDHETVEVPKPKNNFTRNLLLIYLLFILIVGVINFFN